MHWSFIWILLFWQRGILIILELILLLISNSNAVRIVVAWKYDMTTTFPTNIHHPLQRSKSTLL